MISVKERQYLRELAKQQKELSEKPVMQERKRLWYLHNSLQGERPMVVMEEGTFLREIMPPLKCENEDARRMESQLMEAMLPEMLFQDDKVIFPEFKGRYSD